MIKNSFWQKFKLKTERNYNPEKDRKNIMNLVKPLSEKEIKKLRHGKLQIFIDDIISNKKVNHLLFSHNAKKELEFFYRQQNQVLKNMNFIKSYNPLEKNRTLSEFGEISLKKKSELMFKTIKHDIEEYKKNKKLEDKIYKIRLCKLIKNSPKIDNEQAKLFFKSVNDIRYSGYKRSMKTCFEKCKSDPNFNLPDVSLDINDAFSRLYHNMILTPIKTKKSKNKNKSNSNTISSKKKISILKSIDNINTIKSVRKSLAHKEESTDDFILNIRNKKKFNLKEYFKENKGKEFLIPQCFSTKNFCWKKNSGGPNIKLDPPGKINLNKFKRNKTLDKGDNFVIDVNDYRDENLNSNLHFAVENNCEKLVKYFLDKNFSPNEQNKFGDTPFHYAIKLKNKNIIKLLVNDGADSNIKNNKGITPYDLADRDLINSFNFSD